MTEDEQLLARYKHLLVPETESILTGEPRDPATGGPQRKPVDDVVVIKLAQLGCTSEEIADIVNLDGSNVRRRYGALLRAIKSETRSSIRRAQLNKALGGDTTMLIWLGKNWLKQSDSGERLSEDNQILPWQD